MRQTIPPRVGAETLIVVFSDSIIRNAEVRCGALDESQRVARINTYIAHPDNITAVSPRLADAFCYGNFVIEVTVICDEGVQSSIRFVLEVQNDWKALKMTPIAAGETNPAPVKVV